MIGKVAFVSTLLAALLGLTRGVNAEPPLGINQVSYCYVAENGSETCSAFIEDAESAMRADHPLGPQLATCPDDDPRRRGPDKYHYCVPDVASSYVETVFQAISDNRGLGPCGQAVWPVDGCATEDDLFQGLPVDCTVEFTGDYEAPSWYSGFDVTRATPGGAQSAWVSVFRWPESDRQYHVNCKPTEDGSVVKQEVWECPIPYTGSGMSGDSMDLYQDYELGQPIYPPVCRARVAEIELRRGERKPVGNCPNEGNPCVPSSGEKTLTEVDFVWWGISFVRHYTSTPKRGIGESALGPAWSANWDSELASVGIVFPEGALEGTPREDKPSGLLPPLKAWFTDAQDQLDEYLPVATTQMYRPSRAHGPVLEWGGQGTAPGITSTATLHRSATERYRYFDGSLRAIERVDDPMRTLRFDDSHSPPRIVAGNGHFLVLHGRVLGGASDGPRHRYYVIERIDDDAGNVLVTYDYAADGNLIAARYPDGKKRTYHYAEIDHLCGGEPASTCVAANYRHLLTGITDERELRYADYYYLSDGRVSRSVHAGGADNTALQYDWTGTLPRTEVTRPEGGVLDYTFSQDKFRRPLQIDTRTASASAPTRELWAYAVDERSRTYTDGRGVVT